MRPTNLNEEINYNLEITIKRLFDSIKTADLSYGELSKMTGIAKSALHRYATGQTKKIPLDAVQKVAKATGVSAAWIMGWSDDKNEQTVPSKFPPPTVTDDYVTFPVIGEIAAGYDSIALEEWEGDTADIPASLLKGRSPEEYFVLRVKGDSMYPVYMENDRVLILKQSTLNYSGQVGAILYDGELATLKKVEFVPGEDWMRLIAINPNVPPKKIEGAELERCKVMGIPKMLIRDIEN